MPITMAADANLLRFLSSFLYLCHPDPGTLTVLYIGLLFLSFADSHSSPSYSITFHSLSQLPSIAFRTLPIVHTLSTNRVRFLSYDSGLTNSLSPSSRFL